MFKNKIHLQTYVEEKPTELDAVMWVRISRVNAFSPYQVYLGLPNLIAVVRKGAEHTVDALGAYSLTSFALTPIVKVAASLRERVRETPTPRPPPWPPGRPSRPAREEHGLRFPELAT